MTMVKTYYAQVPLGIAMKNIERHQQSERSEESHEEHKPTLETIRPAGMSSKNGVDRE